MITFNTYELPGNHNKNFVEATNSNALMRYRDSNVLYFNLHAPSPYLYDHIATIKWDLKDIQTGWYNINVSVDLDKAKFEVCGHKWVDLSEDEYGISLINNSKYGFSCEENQLKMTLLTSPKYPNPEADMGKHEIAYSITTHTNHVRSGKIVQEAYKFNQPLQAVKALGAGKVSNEFSLLNISSNTVIAETLKQAEYSDAVVLRTYQSANATENIKIKLNINAKKCFLCDMLENHLEELKLQNNEVELTIKPFEVVTLKYIV
jgi:alpha-mannosidase